MVVGSESKPRALLTAEGVTSEMAQRALTGPSRIDPGPRTESLSLRGGQAPVRLFTANREGAMGAE